jgi:hypothetical protein
MVEFLSIGEGSWCIVEVNGIHEFEFGLHDDFFMGKIFELVE